MLLLMSRQVRETLRDPLVEFYIPAFPFCPWCLMGQRNSFWSAFIENEKQKVCGQSYLPGEEQREVPASAMVEERRVFSQTDVSHKNGNDLDEWTKKRLEETLDTEFEGKILSGQTRKRALPTSTELKLDVRGEEISTKPTKIPHEARDENSANPESTLTS